MPYCTIEEAWSNSLTQEQLQPYNEKELDLKLKNIETKGKNWSRTYNKLSGHSGPETRLKDMEVVKGGDDSDSEFGVINESSDEEINEEYKNASSQMKELIQENKNLRKLIKSLKKQNNYQPGHTDNTNNSNRDFMLYVFSGIVVIMILENFRKIYKGF